MINTIQFKDVDKYVRKVVQGYHNIYTSPPPEYTISFALRHRLWRSFSLAGQKFSKQTLPLVRDVNSPASQQSSQQPPKQSSLFISEVNSSLHVAPHCKVKNSLNVVCHLTGGLVPLCRLGIGHGGSTVSALSWTRSYTKKRPIFCFCLFVCFPFVKKTTFSGRAELSCRSYICDQWVQTVRLAAAWVWWSDGQCQQGFCYAHIISVRWTGKQQKGQINN